MKKIFLLLMLTPLFVFAQNNPNGEYWQINRWEAKDGMAKEFESAVAKKTKKFNNSQETAILTFRIVTGPDTGKYMRVVGPKSGDFFNEGVSNSQEYAYWMKNVMPYVKDQSGNKRTARLDDLSYNWDNSEGPKKYVEFTTIRLNPGEGRGWFSMMRNDAKLKRANGFTGIRGVFWLVSGGQSEMHVVEPYDAHGERKGVFTDPDFDYRDEYNSMFGWRARTYDQMNAGMSIRDYGGEITETLEFVPEMSTSIE